MIRGSGRAWHRQGRYGSLIGRSVGKGVVLHEVMEKDQEHADQVKLVNSGLNSLEYFARETEAQFGCEELKGAVRFAQSKNKKVMVHANGDIPVATAVRAGCHSIEHGFFMGEDNLKLMAAHRTFWVPTIYTMKAYLKGVRSGLVRGSADVLEKTVEHQLKQLETARKEGVPVAVGTDSGSSGVFHGESFFSELRLFGEAGYPLQEIVRCATAYGAELIGLGGVRGLIEKGGPAHLLVLKGRPEHVLDRSFSIAGMYVHGFRVV